MEVKIFPWKIKNLHLMMHQISMMVDSLLINSFIIFHFSSEENKDDANLAFGGSSVSFKQGRQLLRQYVLN